MRYVMMDTNILLDMIIDRRKNVSVDLVESFIKLLNYNEIKLIIPEIVMHETNKHIEEQLDLVGKKIFNVKKSIQDMCGINGCKVEEFNIEDEKKTLSLKINELYEKYKSNKREYLINIKLTIQNIFNHDNCIIVQDTEQLRNLCIRRRIYKRAPFHYEKKESYADGLITETLIHCWEDNDIILQDEDDIIFVTGNTEDFSETNNKDILHEDIREDLKEVGLLEKVRYITLFSKLIGVELKQEVNNANLEEEFEKELQEQEEIDKELLYADLEDLNRESVGLSSLGSFEDKFVENFYESEFKKELSDLFEKLIKYNRKLEEIESFYGDELINYVNSIQINEIQQFVQKWNGLQSEMEDIPEICDIYGIQELYEWIENKENLNNYLEKNDSLIDDIQYGDEILFYDLEKKQYKLTMDELNLSPENGGTEFIFIAICSNEEICASGRIEISYGNVEFDENSNIGDACEESIVYYTEEIKDFVEKIVEEFEEYIEEGLGIIKKIKKTFEI